MPNRPDSKGTKDILTPNQSRSQYPEFAVRTTAPVASPTDQTGAERNNTRNSSVETDLTNFDSTACEQKA
jgi:hypothetical protein